MRTVAVISRRGGVGKTTLAVNLAVAAHRAGLRTTIIDLDSRRSATAWAKARARPGPTVLDPAPGTLSSLWATAGEGGCELMLLDTPAGAGAETLQALRLADLCVLVSWPNPFDVSTLAPSIKLLRQFDKPGLIVLNQAPLRRMGREAESVLKAIQALRQADAPLSPTGLRLRAAFPASMTRGLSVVEFEPQGPAAREVEGVWAQVRERLAREEHGGADPETACAGQETREELGSTA